MTAESRLIQRMSTLTATGNRVPDALRIQLATLITRRTKEPTKKKTKRGGKRRFYKTREWREFRYQILTQLGAKCMCCGVTPADGAVMNVDHIVPISKAWERRLDPTNMQVLCARCNEGKGGHDQTDWRPPA